ncbi:hypothetical protein ACLBXM_15675 [Xanthobacteraceae bacterium A53D]
MQGCSVREYLAYGVMPFLHGPFARDLARQNVSPWIRDVAQASYVLLEFRLGQSDAAVDLCWGCDRQMLAAPGPQAAALWPAITRFCQMWVRGDKGFSEISSLVFEADDSPPHAPPALFFMLEEDTRDGYPALLKALSDVFSLRLDAAVDGTVRRCLQAAVRTAHIPYIGLMLSRDHAPVRMGVRVGGPDAILRYVDAIGWTGPHAALARFIDTMSRRFDGLQPYVAFDVLDGVQPRLGLEYIFAETRPGRHTPVGAVIDHLVELGLCSPPERDALNHWPGTAIDQRTDQAGSLTHRFLAREPTGFFCRSLAHLKIVFTPNGLQAKAYLECSRMDVRVADVA